MTRLIFVGLFLASSILGASGADIGGRITLTPGSAYMGSVDVSSSQIAFSPVDGDTVKIFGAARNFLSSPTDQVGPMLTLGAGHLADHLYDIFAAWNGTTVVIGSGPAWDNRPASYSVISNATAITAGTGSSAWYQTAQAFNGNTSQVFVNSAYLPQSGSSNAGLQNYLGQDYGASPQAVAAFTLYAPSDDYLIDSGTSPIMQITLDYSDDCSAWTNAFNNSIVPNVVGAVYPFISGYWNGSHRCWRVGIFGDGSHRIKVGQLTFSSAVSTAREGLAHYAGVQANAGAITIQTDGGPVSCAAYECTMLALAHIDPANAGKIICRPSFGLDRECGISNIANEAMICLRAGEPTLTTQVTQASYTYAAAQQERYVFAAAHGNPGNSLSILSAQPKSFVRVRNRHGAFMNTLYPTPHSVAFWSSIARDDPVSQPCTRGEWGNSNEDNPGAQAGAVFESTCDAAPFAGISKFTAIEGAAGNVSFGLGNNGTRGSMGLSACFPY